MFETLDDQLAELLEATRFSVSFNATYLDGSLAGISIPQSITYGDRESFDRALRFYHRVARSKDFIRATMTGNRYTVSNVSTNIS